jgi:hydroxyacylglutathione hydrolase
MLFQIARVVTSTLIKGEMNHPRVDEITAEQLNEKLNSGRPPLLVDTRSKQEFEAGYGHIAGAKWVPLMDLVGTFANTSKYKQGVKDLEAQFGELESFSDQEVVTMCPGGGFSLVAAEIMSDAGFKDVKSLKGGTDGWFKKGYPTTGKQASS